MSSNPQPTPINSVWDIFLAHAGNDEPTARRLYELLSPYCRVFLDSVCLDLGDDWDRELASAQQVSRITVVLVSNNTDGAYYQREEIAAAISMARRDKDAHRVIPVYLEKSVQTHPPYGLNLKHGLYVTEDNLPEVAERLKAALYKFQRSRRDTHQASNTHPEEQFGNLTGVIDIDSKHYIARPADAELKMLIGQPRSFPYILEPRQMGKSSLLVRIAEHARASGPLSLYIDLQLDGSDVRRTYESFAKWLAELITIEAGLDPHFHLGAFSSSLPPGRKLTVFIDTILTALHHNLLLFFDEVDLLLDTPWGIDFMALLRAWHGKGAVSLLWRNRLNIIMSGSSEPHYLLSGTAGSPFNVGHRVILSDFTMNEVAELAQSYGLKLNELELARVYAHLGGHPYLTHNLLIYLAHASVAIDELVTNAHSRIFANHLARLRLQLTPDLIQFLTTLGSKGAHLEQMPATALYRIGILRREGQKVMWRCRLYRDHLLTL